jgi:hypothetical protein
LDRPEQIENITPGIREGTMSLLLKIDRYLRRTNMSRTQFGRLAVNDPRLVTDMVRGRVIGPAVAARITRFMDGTEA